MDITTILLTVIILILCALPLVIMLKNKSKKEKSFKEAISALAAKSNNKIERYDRWNNNIIGIDQLNHKLFFISKKHDKEVHKVIDLSDIAQSSLVKTHHNVRNENASVIKKLELYLILKDKSKPDVVLEFYNAEHDSLTIREEFQLAEKWSAIVESGILKTKDKPGI